MSGTELTRFSQLLGIDDGELLADWLKEQAGGDFGGHAGKLKESELREQSREFLVLLRQASASGNGGIQAPAWNEVRELLSGLSRSRGLQGFSPSETASFVFSLKQLLFTRIRREFAKEPQVIADETWKMSQLLDRLGLFTTEIHQKSREEVINRQRQEMLELSTPVVKLWEGVLALPMIGTSTARGRKSSWRRCSR